ncbi:hypothetical protein OUZ56_028453 [Daphnia magna]|uniref:Uncharacterized protein n=1 Tax=Daphnia magna TaxID=35525 RepID=A0ABR0B3X3_9CRUS|nr:hypothetical protein OUZ56_028453 [Daphnia magna]
MKGRNLVFINIHFLFREDKGRRQSICLVLKWRIDADGDISKGSNGNRTRVGLSKGPSSSHETLGVREKEKKNYE